MAALPFISRLRAIQWNPFFWAHVTLLTIGRALTRLWGRDVMLYTGGVSFFSLLAIFPALAILVTLYSLLSSPQQAAREGEVLALIIPEGARDIVQQELVRLAHAPHVAMSAQGVFALVVGLYASHRGFKAMLAGLSFIHDEDEPRGFVGFNLLALAVLIAAFAVLSLMSAIFLGLRVMGSAFDLRPFRGVPWLFSEWTWASAGLTLGMALIYRWAMSRRPVRWRASLIGGFSAAVLCLFASWAIAFYVQAISQLGATYGSIATVVVFLIWLSWNVNAIFFGGALATEVELSIDAHTAPRASPPGS
ncbi:MAG TPA: YihY/virulence factor BrkB family protein [Phenylobacterium sp.]|jgi:membrane protein|uniref:YihY/virulence factor BrkB family protein n=1 Tax=Phenylobacterium sp. TaxID=1871053 RepID=UPI002BA70E2E|nr:YihY/virulence factor BrkB family protein [Phenylobacterium sp.]HXA38488.1 YihY/virulence factor BrkB family protein [Phenylobacterium sp.]